MQVKEFTLNSSIIEDGKPISEDEEIVEICSRAFYEISKKYFKKVVELENNIKFLRKEQKKYIIIGIALTTLGILLAILTSQWFGILIAIGLVVTLYSHKRYQKLIEEKMTELMNLRPEGSIQFISKIYLPFYIIPYNGGSIVFDARNTGNLQTIELEYIDVHKLLHSIDILESEANNFMNAFNFVANPETIREYDPTAFKAKRLENKIVEILLNIKNILSDVSVTRYEFYLHKPESDIAQALKNIVHADILHCNGNANKVPQRLSVNDAIRIVDNLRGIEIEALKGDVVEVIQNCIPRVNNIIKPLLNELERNIDVVNTYYKNLNNLTEVLLSKYLCGICHTTVRKDDYKLTSIIRDGLKHTLSSLKELGNESAINEIETSLKTLEEIGLEIPEDLLHTLPSGENVAFLDKSNFNIKFECNKHGEISEVVRGVCGADVLARVSVHVFDELKKPILEKADDMFRELDEAGANLRKERLAIAPFEQLYNQLDLEEKRIKSEIESLKSIVYKLR